jgi:ketosteroid isomerase-like protein
VSQANVQVARAMFEAWNAGDMDTYRELLDPDLIGQVAGNWPEARPFVGREAWMRQVVQLRETWDADALEPISDFIDVDDRVVVRLAWRGEGHGPRSSIEFTGVTMLRKGRVVAIENFWAHTEALEAVGLAG